MPASCRNPTPKFHYRVSFLRELLLPNLFSLLPWEKDLEGNISAESLFRRVLRINTSWGMKEAGTDRKKSKTSGLSHWEYLERGWPFHKATKFPCLTSYSTILCRLPLRSLYYIIKGNSLSEGNSQRATQSPTFSVMRELVIRF